MKYTIFDIECDGLLEQVTKIHCLAYQILDENLKEVSKGNLIKYDEILGFILSQEILVGHNIVLYDIPVLEKILNFKLPNHIKTIDTLGLSWYLYDGRTKHGLDEWGKELGIQKPKISSWTDLKLEDYIFRCTEDVRINTKLFIKELDFLNLLYEGNYKSILNYLDFKIDCLKEQQENRISIDLELLSNNEKELDLLIQEKMDKLKNVMPKQPVYKTIKKPKNLYKKDGSLSNLGEKWFNALERNNLSLNYEEEIKEIVDYIEANPGSDKQLKDWLFTLGWKPKIWEEKVSKITGKLSKVPKIYDKDKDEVCDSIKALYIIEPELESLDMLGKLKHRRGVMKSFRECLDSNNTVVASAKGYTSTNRLQHSKPFVNLPKVGKFYGDKIRGLIKVPNENYTLCGSDMSALEDTTKQHYMYYFDPKYVTEMRTPGFDPHIAIAEFGGLMSKDDVEEFKKLKKIEHKNAEQHSKFLELNNLRNIGKQLNFSCLPTDNTEILTPTGFKTFYDLKIGDDIISYNTNKDELEITKITELPFYENADVLKISNSHFSFECTNDHRWFTFKRHKTRNKPVWYTKQFVYTKDLKTEDNIIVSSILKNNDIIYQDNDIELLAWILTEGWIEWSNKLGGTSNSKGNKRGVKCIIGQKKDKELLEKTLSNYEHTTYQRKDGLTYYHLKSREIRALFKRLNLPQKNKKDIDYTELIFKMSHQQRELFINTMLLGDGHYRSNKLSEFSQNRGNILNSFTLALTLNGYYFNTGIKGLYKDAECVNIHIYSRRHITCQKIKQEFSRKVDVFCVNNTNQTFIAKQKDKIVITGNCIYGAGAAKISEAIGIEFNKAKSLHTAYWERNKAVKDIANNALVRVFKKDGTIQDYHSKYLNKLDFDAQKQFMSEVDSMWVRNPISKFWVSLRYFKDIFSAINQNSGVFCFDLYLKKVREKGFKVIFQYHDK